MSERELKVKVRKEFKDPPFYTFHYSAYMGEVGIPDRIGFCEVKGDVPIPFMIELKSKHGELRPAQRAKKFLFERMGLPVLSPCHSIEQAREFKEKLLKLKEQKEKPKR